jgi:hypothetical protein
LLLAAVMLLYQLAGPRAGGYVPWEGRWALILAPATLAGAVLNARRWAAWAAVVLALLATGRGLPWSGGGLEGLKWRIDVWAAGFCPSLGLIFLVLAVVGIGALAIRAADNEASWEVAAARAYVAAMASLAVFYPLDFFAIGRTLARTPEAVLLRIGLLVGPPVVYGLLLWRLWRGPVLWVGLCLASMVVAGVGSFELDRLSIGDGLVISVAAAAGPIWAYRDWRRKMLAERGRGFEVISAGSGSSYTMDGFR